MNLTSIRDLSGYRTMMVADSPPRIEHRADAWYLASGEALGSYPERLTDRLIQGAHLHPDRWLVVRRDARGAWTGIRYGEMLGRARAIGEALLARGLSAQRPVVILSGNDLEHLQMAFGAMLAGIPYAPISPAWTLVSDDLGKLRHAVGLLHPGLVFVSDTVAFRRAIDVLETEGAEIVTADRHAVRTVTAFEDLLATRPERIDGVHASLKGDAIAKFLFTSGSTQLPKAVPTTHRMLCSNQQMLLQTFPQFGVEPPVLVDWLPWNHTFGGSHNVGIAVYNGGTIYIDDGKPVAGRFDETLRNLREIAPTVYFNVPSGWERLTVALEDDAVLRETFFSRVRMFYFAGAGLSQSAWDRLVAVTRRHCREEIRIMSGLGMTETAPSCLFTTGPVMGAGYVGLPAPGCETKLVPVDGKMEVRFRGPHVMNGYWRTSGPGADSAFDGEGYYCTGDAVRFVDAGHPGLGLMFDGRIAEDFKLSTGTFVSVGPMRTRIVSEGAAYVQDAVITGMNRDDVGVLIFPHIDACRRLAGFDGQACVQEVLTAPAVRTYFADLLRQLNRTATGSATFIARMLLLDEPPAPDRGEITDKGSLNQRAVLAYRAQEVEALYGHGEAGSPPILARGAAIINTEKK